MNCCQHQVEGVLVSITRPRPGNAGVVVPVSCSGGEGGDRPAGRQRRRGRGTERRESRLVEREKLRERA